jgi:glyoxylase-like metal-dependent hydrolase (beta-lactamase superfamily II)
MNYIQGQYFFKEVFKSIYLIGCTFNEEVVNKELCEKSWIKMSNKYEFGEPTGNSWLIKGKEKAILIDSAAPVRGLRKFAENLAGVPVIFVLSHGHYDHTFCLEEFDEFWMHRDDIPFLEGNMGFPKYCHIPQIIHFLREGDIFDLGDRIVSVVHIKGHSNGSLLLIDQKTKVLFSGDSIARRILLFDINEQKISDYVNKLFEVKKMDFSYICTSHDRIPLKKTYIDYLINNIIKIKDVKVTRSLFDGRFGEFYSIKIGDEKKEEFLNCSIVAEYKDILVETVEKIYRERKE